MRKNIYTFLAVAFAAGLLAGCGSKIVTGVIIAVLVVSMVLPMILSYLM